MNKYFLLLLLSIASTGFSQTPCDSIQRIGYADSEYIISHLPDYKKIETELKTHATQLENQLKAKYEEYQVKVKAIRDFPPGTPEAVKNNEIREINLLQENIERFKEEAQSSMQKKTSDLMQPIYKRIGKAIEDVAKEKGYSFIISSQVINGGGDILLFASEKENISDLVLKKLGVSLQPNKVAGK